MRHLKPKSLSHLSNLPPLVAPHGGTDARISTNPICISLPATAEHSLIQLDMATSKIALGKARVAMENGEHLDKDCVLDAHGQMTTDPSVMFKPHTESSSARSEVIKHRDATKNSASATLRDRALNLRLA